MKLSLPSLALLLPLAAPAPAQVVCVRGLVEKAPAVSICANNASHQFRCSGLRLVGSSVINLTQYEGQVVEVCGTVVNVTTCRTMTVQAVRVPVDQLVISGPLNGKIARGNLAMFDLGVTPATLWIMLFSNGRGWLELGAPGVLLLPMRFLVFSSGILDGQGKASFSAQVPNDAALVGVEFHFQPVFVTRSLVPSMGNSDCFQVQ
jgi:hypothetical protein